MSRPLGELKLRVMNALFRAPQELRDECVEIARLKSPSSAFDLAHRAAVLAGFAPLPALGIAKATRWLAVIRRDYGMERFNEVVGTLAAASNSTPMA
jgi:hypothetical protein